MGKRDERRVRYEAMKPTLAALRLCLGTALVLAFNACALCQNIPASAPLPNTQELKRRVIATYQATQKNLERYLCEVHTESQELNKDGGVKKRKTVDAERFYINGRQVQHIIAKDGKELSGKAAKDEQHKVDKSVQRFSEEKEVAKAVEEDLRRLDTFLKAMRYSNGRREIRDNRSTVAFDLSGDPDFRATDITGRFAKALVGKLWVDEETGQMREMRVQTNRDVKIAGGLVASLHKGFSLHLQQQRQSDGAWIMTLAEGTGDARAALFYHPRFRFKQTSDHCRLYSVATEDHVSNPKQ